MGFPGAGKGSQLTCLQNMLPSLQYVTTQSITSSFETRMYTAPAFNLTTFCVGTSCTAAPCAGHAIGARGTSCDLQSLLLSHPYAVLLHIRLLTSARLDSLFAVASVTQLGLIPVGDHTAQSDVYWIQHCRDVDGVLFVLDSAVKDTSRFNEVCTNE